MKTVIIGEQKIEVKKLPLGKYAEVMKAMKELPKKVSGISDISNDKLLENLPLILGEAWPEAIKILGIATDQTEDFLNQIGLDDAINLCEAVIEVNNFQQVFEKVKKMTTRQPVQQ